MKKKLLAFLAALLAFASCNKAPLPREGGDAAYRLDALRFDFTVEREDATKGVRSGWIAGDRIYIFLSGISTAYLTIDYDGSAWSKPPTLHGEGTLGRSGRMTAVYLPYFDNSEEPAWNGSAWTFPQTNDYYFLRAEKADYYITDMDKQVPSMGAFLYMTNAEDFVQLYIPDDSASGSVQVACNAVIPAGIGGISEDGSVTTDALAEQGTWITARADEIDAEKGYYLSGRLNPRPGNNYYFVLKSGADSYKHCFKARDAALSGHHAYQLPDIGDWAEVTSGTEVMIAGNKWQAMNVGASTPWEAGTAYEVASMSSAVPAGSDPLIPSDTEWTMIQDRYQAIWVQLSIAGTPGYVVVDRSAPDNFIFLPCAAYWSTSAAAGVQHHFDALEDGTHEIADSTPPASASVRLVSSLREGGFNPPENGGDL